MTITSVASSTFSDETGECLHRKITILFTLATNAGQMYRTYRNGLEQIHNVYVNVKVIIIVIH